MKKLYVSEECIACGQCLVGTELLGETPEGKVAPKGMGAITDEEAKRLQSIFDECPVQAIHIEPLMELHGDEKEKLLQIEDAMKAFCQYTITRLSRENLRCQKEALQVMVPDCGLRSRYSYPSDSRATSEGLKAFDQLIYSKKRELIQSVLIQYKNMVLNQFGTYEENASCYYFRENNKVEQQLRSFAKAIFEITSGNLVISEPVLDFRFSPKDLKTYGLSAHEFETTSAWGTASENVESLRWYETFINTDDKDLATRTVYCYDLHEAVDTISKHILDGCMDAIGDHAERIVNRILDWYQGIVTEEVKQRIETMRGEIDGYLRDGLGQ